MPDTAALQTFLKTIFSSNKLLGVADLFSGGALTNFSIIMMGLGPFINATIIIQLLSQVVPKLEALNKEGEQGRRQLNNTPAGSPCAGARAVVWHDLLG